MDIDKEISQAHLNSTGWSLDSHHSSNPIEAHALFYVVDMVSGQIVLATASREAFESIPVNDEAGEFADMIRAAVHEGDGDLPPEICGPLVGYTKATQVYRVWRTQHEPDARMHIIILLYPSCARPVMTPWPKTVIDHDALVEIAAQVVSQDKAKHPEWFE